MPPLKTILFMGLFVFCTVGALGYPILGVLGYMGHYMIGPERQWWFSPVSSLGIRYSFTLGLVTALGVVFNYRSLRAGARVLLRHEKLILLFLGLIWLMYVATEPTYMRSHVQDHVAVKLTKVVFFALLLSHVVTTTRQLDRVFWILVIGSLILGVQAYDTPLRRFASGRLETVGGPDFRSSNILAAFLASMLPIIGLQFLRTRWLGKLVCAAAGVFAVNGIVLTRSRGALVGLGCSAVYAVWVAPKRHRMKMIAGLVVGSLGLLYLADPGFMRRAGTIDTAAETDDSAKSRIETWRASVKMLKAHPLGVGPGNWYQSIGRYDARYAWRDAHNTFVRCYGEMGVPGLVVFLGIIVHGLAMIRRLRRRAENLPPPQAERFTHAATAVAISVITFLGCGLTVTMLYVESLWWLLMLPACLQRVMDNLEADVALEPVVEPAKPAFRRARPTGTVRRRRPAPARSAPS